MTLRAVVLVVILGACAEQREEIVETTVPLYMEAGPAAASAVPSASATDDRGRLSAPPGAK